MLRIKAEKLLAYTTEQLMDNLEGDFILVFRNGELVTNERECQYSSFIWDLHRTYPKTPLLKEHHVKSINGDNETSVNAHLKLINAVIWTVYDTYVNDYKDKGDLLEELSKQVYLITNLMYNDLSYRLEEYVTSLDITDFIKITKLPVVASALETVSPTQEGIETVSKLIQDQIKSAPELKYNPLAISIRTGNSRLGQALQCLGPRGYLTDVDSNIFRYPIMSSYISGIRSLYDSLIESRSASKSLFNSTKPLQDSEYFSRRQQLICQNVKNIHYGDCGSTNYLLWHVRDVTYEGVTKISSGDLKTIAGKYYLDEEVNPPTLRIVKSSDAHLIGKAIKLRSVVAGCNHPDPYGVCETCYGDVALAIPKNSNLGHLSCVTMTAILAQLILSTKHFDGSSVVEGIVLKPLEKRFLASEINGSRYFLNPKIKDKDVKIQINVGDAPGLPDINRVSDVNQLNTTRVSEFPMILMSVGDSKGVEINSLTVCVNARKSSMTHDFLNFIKQKGYNIIDDGKGNSKYEFDMTGWDYEKPIFVLPLSHFNTSDHQNEIAKMLESTAKEMEQRSNNVSPEAMLVEFYDLVNRRIQVNLSILEVILYSSMVVDAMNDNYDLPKPWTPKGMGVMRQLILNRSLSAQMGYQSHREAFFDPTSFIKTNRMDHIFDAAFLPHEVLGN